MVVHCCFRVIWTFSDDVNSDSNWERHLQLQRVWTNVGHTHTHERKKKKKAHNKQAGQKANKSAINSRHSSGRPAALTSRLTRGPHFSAPGTVPALRCTYQMNPLLGVGHWQSASYSFPHAISLS